MSIDDARARRAERAQALAALENGDTTLQSVLERVPDALGTAELFTVLLATPKLGRKGAKRLCLDAGVIWPLTLMNQLTDRNKEDLIRCLPDRVKVV